MISWLKKIFGKEDKFFDLLEAGAQEAKTSVNLLASYLHTLSAGGPPANLDDFVQSRRKEKRIRYEMTEQLSRTFVTPLEREDIEALSFALYRIPKSVEKIVERLSIYPDIKFFLLYQIVNDRAFAYSSNNYYLSRFWKCIPVYRGNI